MNRLDYYFKEISNIPRGSYNEKSISQYLENFAIEHHFNYVKDDMGNIVIYKPATSGYEDHEVVMLQGHMDMVCEKNNDTVHDFEKDPIQLIEKDGYLHANGTTLGADDGIAVCYMLAILEDDTLQHPALECTFTVQEEVGLNGANNLKKEYFHATRMIGLDSEDEHVITISCSGGRRVFITHDLSYTTTDLPAYQLSITGLLGGHSGGCIHEERGNANVLMARLYYHLHLANIDFQLASFNGGLKDNAIPRECVSTFVSQAPFKEIEAVVLKVTQDIQTELSESDAGVHVELKSIDAPAQVISSKESLDIISMMYLMPNGFVAKSLKMNGLTTISLNMGIVKMEEDFKIFFAIRSPMESAKDELSEKLKLIASLYGAHYELDNNYPGWKYDPESKLRELYIDFVKKSEGIDLIQEGTHGGLETGIIKGLLGDLDIITMGPEMHDIHTPDERLNIASFHHCYERLVHFLETL